ncbi:MAG: hypothetical protein Q8Q92_05100 [bacterium]|nr:hypothetical protein [bacterium]
MPLILIKRDPDEVDDRLFAEIREKLPAIVAEELTISDPRGRLTPQEIEIWPFEKGLLDTGEKALQIVVIANEYQGRLDVLDIRGEKIKEALAKLMPVRLEGKSWVWILLAPAYFGEF